MKEFMQKLLPITLVVAVVMTMTCFTGCSEADKVSVNMSKEADYFNCVRKITVYNTWTDTIFLEMEGNMSIHTNSTNELEVICKVDKDKYKKNFIYLNAFTTYVVEDIGGADVDPYHYKVYFHTEIPFDIETKP